MKGKRMATKLNKTKKVEKTATQLQVKEVLSLFSISSDNIKIGEKLSEIGKFGRVN